MKAFTSSALMIPSPLRSANLRWYRPRRRNSLMEISVSGPSLDAAATALRKLTEIQRAVLVAKVYDTMTFAQIAAELDLAVSTVKTHYLRAVRALRNQLEPRWAE